METGKSANKIGWQMGAELGVRLTAGADSYVATVGRIPESGMASMYCNVRALKVLSDTST